MTTDSLVSGEQRHQINAILRDGQPDELVPVLRQLEKDGDEQFLAAIERLQTHRMLKVRYRARRAFGAIRIRRGIRAGHPYGHLFLTTASGLPLGVPGLEHGHQDVLADTAAVSISVGPVRSEESNEEDASTRDESTRHANESLPVPDDPRVPETHSAVIHEVEILPALLECLAAEPETQPEDLLLFIGRHPDSLQKREADALLDHLRSPGDGGPGLLLAAASLGYLELIQALVAAGVQVDVKTELGHTPLMMAIWSGHSAIADFLLSRGADPNCPDRHGFTALNHSALQEPPVLLPRILAAHARVNRRDPRGWTVLMQAASDGRDETCHILLQAGAHPDTSDDWGNTALQVAAFHGHLSVVQQLLAASVRVDHPDVQQATALMKAAAGGFADVTACLLKAGADHRLRDKAGFTALIYAVDAGRHDVVMTLLKRGADPRTTCSDGTSVIALARSAGDEEMIAILRNAVKGS